MTEHERIVEGYRDLVRECWEAGDVLLWFLVSADLLGLRIGFWLRRRLETIR